MMIFFVFFTPFLKCSFVKTNKGIPRFRAEGPLCLSPDS